MSKNDVTGDELKSKSTTDKYREGYDLIFKKKEKNETEPVIENTKQSSTE